MPTPSEEFFREQGLEPLSWEEVLLRVEQKLTQQSSKAEAERFGRLHRAFIAYPTEHTARGFYDFAADHGLLAWLAGFRFGRLVAIADAIATAGPVEGLNVLDVGAGGGHLAAWLRAQGARVTATDLSPGARAHLARAGHAVLENPVEAEAHGLRFDLVVCADSLGEIHADEDGWLADPDNLEDPDYSGELEARYGFAEKLAAFKGILPATGAVLLFEPIDLAHFWFGAARLLEAHGWKTEVLASPARGLRLER